MKKLLLILILLLVPILSFPPTVSAQFKEWGDCVDIVADPSNPSRPPAEVPTLRCIPVVFRNVVSGFLIFVGVFALFLIIYSGIRLVTSGGDPKKVEGARKIMNYAIIGVIIVLSSFAIIYFIGFITKSEPCITNIDSISDGGCK